MRERPDKTRRRVRLEEFDADRHSSLLADLRPVWGEPLPKSVAELRDHVRRWLDSPEPGAFVVERDGRAVGLLLGVAIASGYRINEFHCASTLSWGGVLETTRETFAGQRVELLVAGGTEPPGFAKKAAARGFALVLDQVHYEAELGVGAATCKSALRYRHYRDLGPAVLLEALERIWSDAPSPTGRPALEEMEEWLAAEMDGELTTDLWRVAYVGGELAGVALAHVHPRAGDVGTLVYLALVGQYRGRGLGRALHRDALALLATEGATRYVDATAVANAAMRRLFVTAGCEAVGRSRLYAAPHTPDSVLPAARMSAIGCLEQLGLPAIARQSGTLTRVRRPSGLAEIEADLQRDGLLVLRHGGSACQRLPLDREGKLDPVLFRVALWRAARCALRVRSALADQQAANLGLEATRLRPGGLLASVPINSPAAPQRNARSPVGPLRP